MHPGPVNRGVELAAEVIDSPQALIVQQVESGVVVRMAVLYELLAGGGARRRPSAARRARARAAAPHEPPRSTRHRSTARRPAADRADPRRAPARPARRARRRRRHAGPRRRDRRDRRAGLDGARRAPRSSTPRACTPFPAFVDPHVHLRTPGREDEEDIDSGTRAAAAGGYCAILAQPNTDPVVDSAPILRLAARARPRRGADPDRLHWPRSRAGRTASSSPRWPSSPTPAPSASPTTACPVALGGRAAPGAPVPAARRAALIALHEEDPSLSGDGAMHEGAVSALLGMAGIPSISESTMIARDARIAGYEDGRIHIQHVSARESVEAIERGQGGRASQITAEATPHHLLLTDEAVRSLDANFKMNPPLRARGRPPGADRRRCARARSTASPPTTPRTRARRRSSRSSSRRWA